MSLLVFRSSPASIPAPQAAPVVSKIVKKIGHGWEQMLQYWRIRQAERHLLQFDDHLLKDIGLSRDNVEYTVRNGRTHFPT